VQRLGSLSAAHPAPGGIVGRKPVPADLALRLRVAMSQELANTQRSRWEMMRSAGKTPSTPLWFPQRRSDHYPAHLRVINELPGADTVDGLERRTDHALHAARASIHAFWAGMGTAPTRW